jgi:hypothetical protein
MAIYRDTFKEEEFQTCLKEVQAAQSDLARLRFENEFRSVKFLPLTSSYDFAIYGVNSKSSEENEMRERRQQRRMGREGPAMSGDHLDHPPGKG